MNRGYVGLTLTIIVTLGVISYVHIDQRREISRMREGLVLDVIREEKRRKALRENQNDDHSSS